MKWECYHQRLITYTRELWEGKNEQKGVTAQLEHEKSFSVFFWISGNEIPKDTFFYSLGHIKSCPHCIRTGTIFFSIMAKKILSHPIIALDNWRPMAFFFIVLGKTIPVK